MITLKGGREVRIPAIDRLDLTVKPGGKTCLFLHAVGSDRGVTLDDLPPRQQVELLKEWALDVADGEAPILGPDTFIAEDAE